jgi:hypothetical protein
MKSNTVLTTALVFAVSLPAFAGTPTEGTESPQHKDVMAKCEQKAKEHKIPEAQMESYMSTCTSKHMHKAQGDATTPAKQDEMSKLKDEATGSVKKVMPSGE